MCVVSILKVKAGLRTLIPVEQKYIEEEPKVSKQVHQQPSTNLLSSLPPIFFFDYLHPPL